MRGLKAHAIPTGVERLSRQSIHCLKTNSPIKDVFKE